MRQPYLSNHRRRSLLCGALGLCLALAAAGCRQGEKPPPGADSFPRKPIKVVVPFAAGGDSDSFARIMQKALRDHDLLPQPLVILNVPGAGGTVGSRRVRDAAADGYTILNLHEGIWTSKYAGRVTYGPQAFRPIAATGQSHLVICVRADAPYTDLGDLLEAAAERPDSLLFGMAQGTPTHFAARRLEVAGGKAQFRMVASGGGAKRFNDLIGKHIDATPFSLAEFIAYEGGGIRAIGYLAAERHPALAQVPTARELGYEVVMPHVHYWWAPRATPDAVVGRLADALEAAMSTPFVRGKLAESKTDPLFLRGSALDAHLASLEGDFQDIALVRYEGLPDPVLPVIILCAALAAVILLKGRSMPINNLPWRHGVMTVAVLSSYVLTMQLANAPYPLATMLVIPALGCVAGARSCQAIARITAIGVALAWACFLVFSKVLVIDLP